LRISCDGTGIHQEEDVPVKNGIKLTLLFVVGVFAFGLLFGLDTAGTAFAATSEETVEGTTTEGGTLSLPDTGETADDQDASRRPSYWTCVGVAERWAKAVDDANLIMATYPPDNEDANEMISDLFERAEQIRADYYAMGCGRHGPHWRLA
jgi:hypothetical protein